VALFGVIRSKQVIEKQNAKAKQLEKFIQAAQFEERQQKHRK